MLSTPFSPQWFHDEDALQLGAMNVLSGLIARTERKHPGIIPDLRGMQTIFIGSDSGGLHSTAQYEVTGWLFSNMETIGHWDHHRSILRTSMLPNRRRMSY